MKSLCALMTWRWVGVLTICCVMAMGCAYQAPPPSPLGLLTEVTEVLDTVNERGFGERFPDELAALQARYQEARHEYYSSRTQASSEMSMSIIADANALMSRPWAEAVGHQVPENQAPVARLSAPATGDTASSVPLDGSASVDPEGDPLIYNWDFGDGTSYQVPWPQTEHRYGSAGAYTVQLTVIDHEGNSDTASATVEVEQAIVIPRPVIVLFQFDAMSLQDADTGQLGQVAQAMKQQPDLQADVVGHTDSMGTEAYNLALSQSRAQAVSDYLTTSGVAASRINTSWRGESEPAFPNTTDEYRGLNRRVEVTVRPPM